MMKNERSRICLQLKEEGGEKKYRTMGGYKKKKPSYLGGGNR